MHSTAPVIISSPRHAPAGAADRPEPSAAATVEADAAADSSAETGALLERLLAYEAARPLRKTRPAYPTGGPVLPLHFRKGDTSFRLFTMIATLGTPQDVMLQEVRIESFFPMDAEQRAVSSSRPEFGVVARAAAVKTGRRPPPQAASGGLDGGEHGVSLRPGRGMADPAVAHGNPVGASSPPGRSAPFC